MSGKFRISDYLYSEPEKYNSDKIISAKEIIKNPQHYYDLSNSLKKKKMSINSFEHKPVYIDQFLEDKYFLNLKSVLRPAIKQDLLTLFDGEPFKWKYREVIFNEAIGCSDAHSQYLGRFGWRNIDEYKQGEEIAVYNSDGEMFFEVPKNYYKFPATDWYSFQRRCGIDQKLSKEHRVIWKSSKGVIRESSMEEIYNKHVNSNDGFYGKFITTFSSNGNLKLPYSNDFIRLLIAISADGCKTHKKYDYYQFEFKKERKIKRLEELLKKCNIKHHITFNKNRNTTIFRFTLKEGFKKFPSNWYSLNQNQLKVICDEVLKWDGSEKGTYYCTSEKQNADFIQFVFSSCGYRSNISCTTDNRLLKNDNTKTRKPNYQVGKKDDILVSLSGKDDKGEKIEIKVEKPKENEFKYCFETSTSYWIMRRNDKIVVTGNTGKSYRSAIIAIFSAYNLLCLYNPSQYFGLDNKPICIMNTSVSAKNAKDVIYTDIFNRIVNCEWFRDHYMPNPEKQSVVEFDYPPDQKQLEKDRVYKKILIVPGSSAVRGLAGYDLFCGLIDESTLYPKTENSDVAEQLYRHMSVRIRSRFGNAGIIVMTGSPQYSGDFNQRKIKEAKANCSKEVYYVEQRALWDAKYFDPKEGHFYFDTDALLVLDEETPDYDDYESLFAIEGKKSLPDHIIQVPNQLKPDFISNPLDAKKDLAGIPTDSLKPIFGDASHLVKKHCNYQKRNPINPDQDCPIEEIFDEDFTWLDEKGDSIDEYAYFTIGVDLGISNDAACMSMGHIEGLDEDGQPIIDIDFMYRFKPTAKKRFTISRMREMIYELSRRGFPIALITYDGFQSADSIQILQQKGYNAKHLSVDRDNKPYSMMVDYIIGNRLDYPYHPVFMKEAVQLEFTNGGKIDHPITGSKDLSDTIAQVIFNLSTILEEVGDDLFLR